jgi:molybdate transport system substrate-binding protein
VEVIVRRAIPSLLATALALVSACGDDGGAEGAALVVFAAASLTDAFEEAADAFEDANPGTSVELNLAASSALREQIVEGAPADVFASANGPNMDAVVEAGEAENSEVFALNQLEIVVPAGNEAGVSGLDDFARAELFVGLCAEEVPCGAFGRDALANAGVEPSIDTDEPDVRALLAKVQSGDLDAGLVYRTDVLAAGDAVEGIDVPDEHDVVAAYPIAVLSRSEVPDVADAFVAFVLSAEGQEILASHGFDGP